MEELCDGLSFYSQDRIAKIFINSEITTEVSQNFVDLLYGLEFLKDEVDAVVISISSPGGLVLEGYSMYSCLKMSTLPIYIINTGIVASIAGIIFLGVDYNNRYAFDNTLFMFHNSHGGDNQSVNDKIDNGIRKVLETSISSVYLQQMMDDETWLNIDEQIMYNIIPFNNKLSVKEKFDISQFVEAEESNAYLIYNSINIIKNNEENMSKNILEKLKGIFNKAESEVIVETKEEIFVEEVSEITESLEEVESVVESIVEDVVSEELVEAIVEPIIDPIISKSEVEILQEELLIVKELLKEKENVLLEIENSKKLELKKTFLIENKIEVTEELLKMDIEVIKPIVNSLKINKVAPSIPQITNSLNSELSWEKLSNEERNELAKTDINLFNRIFANRKK